MFRHSARSITVWADPVTVPQPQPAAAAAAAAAGNGGAGPAAAVGLAAVQALLEAEFPDCNDLSADEGRGICGFVPHLSLGQLRVGLWKFGEGRGFMHTWRWAGRCIQTAFFRM